MERFNIKMRLIHYTIIILLMVLYFNNTENQSSDIYGENEVITEITDPVLYWHSERKEHIKNIKKKNGYIYCEVFAYHGYAKIKIKEELTKQKYAETKGVMLFVKELILSLKNNNNEKSVNNTIDRLIELTGHENKDILLWEKWLHENQGLVFWSKEKSHLVIDKDAKTSGKPLYEAKEYF